MSTDEQLLTFALDDPELGRFRRDLNETLVTLRRTFIERHFEAIALAELDLPAGADEAEAEKELTKALVQKELNRARFDALNAYVAGLPEEPAPQLSRARRRAKGA